MAPLVGHLNAVRFTEAATAVGVCSIAAVAITWPLALRLGEVLPNYHGDLHPAVLNAWILAWDADRLLHGLSGFWHAPIFYPYTHTLAFSDHLLGIAFFTAWIQWITGNPLAAHNAAILASYVLAGSGMYLLATYLTRSRLAGAVAAVAFMMLPVRGHEGDHVQVVMYGWMPVALWALHLYFDTRWRPALVVFAAAFLLQGLSNGYYFYFLAFAVAVIGGVESAVHLRVPARRRRMLLDLTVTLVAMLVAVAPVVMGYLAARARYGAFWDGEVYRLGSWDSLNPGFAVLALAACGLGGICLRRGETPNGGTSRRVALGYAMVAVLGVAIAHGSPTVLGVQLPIGGVYDLLREVVPGFDTLRAVRRGAIITLLALTVLCALGVRLCVLRFRLRVAVTFALAVGGLAFVEGYHPVPLTRFGSPPTVEAANAWLRTRPPGAALNLPVGVFTQGETDDRYMLDGLSHPHPILNGASGYFPPLFWFLQHTDALRAFHRYGDVLRGLRALGVRYLIVDTAWRRRDIGRETLRAVLRQPDQVLATRNFGRIVVVELLPWNERPAGGPPQSSPIAIDPSWARTSHAPRRLPYAFDGDEDTRWLTERPQSGDEWVSVQFDQSVDVAYVRLWMARRSFGDYPRGLRVEVSRDGSTFEELYHGRGFPGLLLGAVQSAYYAPIDVALPPNRSRVIRLRQTGRTPTFYWSIHELQLWERCRECP
jgi:hypothetical protein